MDTFTHLAIAKTVQRTIENELSVKLDTMAFRYGSIKPDISPELVKIPHYKDDAIDFIKSQIESLVTCKEICLPKCTREFSQKLGVIIHYLADFFCYVHSTHYKGGMVAHYLYEAGLSSYFRLRLKRMKFYRNLPVSLGYSCICNFIDEQHEQYMIKTPSYEVDMDFTLRVCISVCLSIVSASLVDEMTLAA